MHIDYIVRKIGLDPDILVEFEKAKQIMAKKEIIELGEYHQIKSMWPQICVMLANVTEEEFSKCLEEKEFPDSVKAIEQNLEPMTLNTDDVTALHDAV